ncbi:hypothetical protein AAW00_08455 [Aurantiacibacter luteus]|uniref:Phytase-like domain-containing protein n=1 Tax=Aurantiacibacter luteus TaxID=1581420 RepID=A0A0G9MWB1_9SPHN|nr:hypothetical protein AAW00_08455 [Aurantiacibacter luteus]
MLAIAPVDDLPEAKAIGGFTREGVWQLASPNIDFGGYSALVTLGPGEDLVAWSDRGMRMAFARPGSGDEGRVRFDRVDDRGPLSSAFPDIEAAMRDPASGRTWLALENANAVLRYDAASRFEAARRPPEWTEWGSNAGPEAMERLADGRFIVLPEARATGLLFSGDPTEEGAAQSFAVSIPHDYDATDLAALPDGRVLVLLRKLALGYPPFTAALGIADPAELERGDALMVRLLVDLDALVPPENWEGLASESRGDGRIDLWLIADDNSASFQRTLLAKLVLDPRTLPAAQ